MNVDELANNYNRFAFGEGIIEKATSAFLSVSMSIGMSEVPKQSYKLIQNGLTEDMTSSRPYSIPGERQIYIKKSSAKSLLNHATGWAGDDLDKRLSEVYEARGEVEF